MSFLGQNLEGGRIGRIGSVIFPEGNQEFHGMVSRY
jgi:hypothetical protein